MPPGRVLELLSELAATMAPIMVLFLIYMKKLAATTLFISMLLVLLLGCATPGPSPEQQARDADQQREAARQQADFRKSLPPVSNPGQGWRD